eukprot:3324227-Alexandrium_andersonii.AAC.1
MPYAAGPAARAIKASTYKSTRTRKKRSNEDSKEKIPHDAVGASGRQSATHVRGRGSAWT